MTEIRLVIEGEDAIDATEALLAIPEIIPGGYKVTEEPERETILSTVAAIVGIIGGGIAIAEQIRKWYEEYKKGQSGKRIEKVVIIIVIGRNEERILLIGETIDDKTLKKLAQRLDDLNTNN
ncbi:hypothetical protein [Brasilonema sp. UFV-L1]|uniref:hypothetical protein n=1 Tax=Brasilonema sp. UFV-L1 TaxID=2234130 RepID=UPI00145E0142|nr:hypothetical protein [Brasilonema sp. UFV-L1]NMG06407.1 hypothetical protein [Brasilonema sp. UFV-L1]